MENEKKRGNSMQEDLRNAENVRDKKGSRALIVCFPSFRLSPEPKMNVMTIHTHWVITELENYLRKGIDIYSIEEYVRNDFVKNKKFK